MAPKKKNTKKDKDETPTRIAVVSSERCKPKKCKQECKKYCPVVKVGKLCVEVTPSSKLAWISEELCIGCGICVKKCPFDAIQIINLPSNLEGETTHRYGPNSFKLHRLPTPRAGQVRFTRRRTARVIDSIHTGLAASHVHKYDHWSSCPPLDALCRRVVSVASQWWLASAHHGQHSAQYKSFRPHSMST